MLQLKTFLIPCCCSACPSSSASIGKSRHIIFNQSQLRFGTVGCFISECLHLQSEGVEVLKIPIHGGISNVGHPIKLPQSFHHHLAYDTTLNLSLAEAMQLGIDICNYLPNCSNL